jgi:hypothetical protein
MIEIAAVLAIEWAAGEIFSKASLFYIDRYE